MLRPIFLFTVSFKGYTSEFSYVEESEQRAFTEIELGWQWARKEFDLNRYGIHVNILEILLEGMCK